MLTDVVAPPRPDGRLEDLIGIVRSTLESQADLSDDLAKEMLDWLEWFRAQPVLPCLPVWTPV